jgi:hypothetical protein
MRTSTISWAASETREYRRGFVVNPAVGLEIENSSRSVPKNSCRIVTMAPVRQLAPDEYSG